MGVAASALAAPPAVNSGEALASVCRVRILAVASVHGGQIPDEGCASVEDELRGKCEAGDLSLGFWLDSARGWIRDGGRRRGWPDEDRAFGA